MLSNCLQFSCLFFIYFKVTILCSSFLSGKFLFKDIFSVSLILQRLNKNESVYNWAGSILLLLTSDKVSPEAKEEDVKQRKKKMCWQCHWGNWTCNWDRWKELVSCIVVQWTYNHICLLSYCCWWWYWCWWSLMNQLWEEPKFNLNSTKVCISMCIHVCVCVCTYEYIKKHSVYR